MISVTTRRDTRQVVEGSTPTNDKLQAKTAKQPKKGFTTLFNFATSSNKPEKSYSTATIAVGSDLLSVVLVPTQSNILKTSKNKNNNNNNKPKEKLRFAEEPVVIENSMEPLTEEEHAAYFLTKGDEERIEKERLLVLAKYNRHKRNPARTKFDDNVDGPIRGLEEVVDVRDIQKCKIIRKEHVSTILDEQKRLRAKETSAAKQTEVLASASKKVSKKYMADAQARGKLDAAAAADRPKAFSLW